MTLRTLPRRFLLMLLVVAGLAPVLAACGPAAVAGNPNDYSVNTASNGQRLRWNPCTAIHWRADLRLAPPTGLTEVKNAVATLSKTTGIEFVYDGTTSYIPQGSAAQQPAPLVVSFARHRGLPLGSNKLAGGTQVGEGGYYATGSGPSAAQLTWRISTGFVVLDADAYRFRSSQIRTSTVLHELGHAVGLNHAKETAQVMYPTITTTTPTTYSAGDTTGLKLVGRPAGCL